MSALPDGSVSHCLFQKDVISRAGTLSESCSIVLCNKKISA